MIELAVSAPERRGRGRDRRPRATGATCIACGLVAGNPSGIPVHRYRLARTSYADGRARTVAIASIGLCDPCIQENGHPPRDYSGRATAVRHRHLRSRSNPDDFEIHTHGQYEAAHTHAALGPAQRLERPN